MSWIEGIGDEVVIAVSIFVVLAVLLLSWKSTEVREPPATRLRFTITTLPASRDENTRETELPREESVASSSLDNIPLIVRREDLIQNHPIIPRNIDVANITSDTHPGNSRSESTRPGSGDTVFQAPAKDETPARTSEDCELRQRNVATSSVEGSSIKIKLVYLDDTHKFIEANLNQTLGDFKKQHFEPELLSNKVIKLIFNGQVLNGEMKSLTQLGLSENCVVHCLIHQARTPATPSAANHSTEEIPANRESFDEPVETGSTQQQEEAGIVDMGGFLVPLFGLVLGIVWYFRLAHAAHFTAAATVALVGLSGLFIVSLIGVYFPAAQEGVA